ncbi:putative COP9 signalosome subunit 4 (CsnD) [Aspergillus clavatus NRRL 1]|uniref:COP9 signalosome complex subunit 4 n=1 Tax=Aspergillus clavatus (strain ATCC 1007 / CBS 513.65 / DSM 816 / NCTC 3887 / NRRL 1 / QM 1276 / 107) TaxID=344612 RepID=A1C490_ASPCL|nr:COP9 signalosome subunit 4 (CsnD), putative [Aspergillus clavatus NRRL 1]EAW15230.1 COP9 signalosome subunit 4 (CsnD), putative [Aspergillus clavatus NRRL 1]
MASQRITSALAEIEASSNPQNKLPQYNNLLSEIVSTSSEHELGQDLIYYIDSVLSEEISIVAARPLLDSFIGVLQKLSPETQIKVGQHAVTLLQSRSSSVEEQDSQIREILADAYESEEDYTAAARALQGIHIDSSQRLVSDAAKVRLWIRIVRLYLEEDDTTSAEAFLNRIKNLPSKIEDQELKLHFKLSQARILDARRRFLDASQEYFNVSLAAGVDESDRLQALAAAIRCAVLAPAGPQRSRILATLYKDDRATSVDEFGILEKMFLDRLLNPAEIAAFSERLAPHQLAQTADGTTVLDKAVVEHNLVAASKLYENITTDALGAILGLTESGDLTAGEKAEAYAARMVEQGRLNGSIDQIAGVIYFDSSVVGSATAPGRHIRQWDAGVQGLAEDVERVAASITDAFPVRALLSCRWDWANFLL